LTLTTDIIRILTSHRFTLADEKLLQVEIAAALATAGVSFRREVHLGPGDIVDFMIDNPFGFDGIAIEVKVKGNRRAIFKQLQRYCAYREVGAILLATNVPMDLPATIHDKPASIAALGRGWL